MTKQPKLSIIIPVYNAEHFISRCLESILSNTFTDYEMLLVNDGSTDASRVFLNAYQKQHPEKIFVFHQENGGAAHARNFGLSKIQGKYVTFIDIDDWIEKDYLQKFIAEIEKNDADMVIGGYKHVSDKKILSEVLLENNTWSKYRITTPWAKMFQSEFLLRNHIEFLEHNESFGEDVYFNLQAIHLTQKISILRYSGYRWFFNITSLSNTHKNLKNKEKHLFLLESCRKKLEELHVPKTPEVEFFFLRYIIWYILLDGRKSTPKEILAGFDLFFSWLQKNFAHFANNPLVGLFSPKGEPFQNRLFLCIFMILYKFNLIKLFLRLYTTL